MADQYLFRFDEQGLDRVIQRVEEFRRIIRQVGQAGDLGDGFQRFFNQFIAGTRQSTGRIRDLRAQLESLGRLAQSLGGPEGRAPISEGTRRRLAEQGVQVEEGSSFREEIERRLLALKTEESRLNQILLSEEQRLTQEVQRQANLAAFNNRLEASRVNLINQIRDVTPGGSRLNQLVLERENALLERQRQLREQLAAEVARFGQTTPRQAEETLGQEIKLQNQLHGLLQARLRAQRELTVAEKAAADAGLGRPGAFAGRQSEEERNALLQRQQELQARIASAQETVRNINLSILRIEQQRSANLERLAALQGSGAGGAKGIIEIQNRLRQVDELLTQLRTSGDAVGDVFGQDVLGQLAQVQQVLRSFEGRNLELLTPEETQELGRAQARAQQLLNTINKFPEQGIPLSLNEDELARVPGVLNRILLGAARDFGRRFTATLQFAISGALLFGAQRLLREFFDAAVEVERTFADISSALEFDIDAERGTAAFERELEGVRRQVLQIADDFNALPTEVNQAAFQMISRFQNVQAALIATRAQVLATRIATIDQSEALRALTAVAEASAFRFHHLARSERELAVANEQLRALDFATAIQQQFQVPIEDTLEGAAGLVAVFQGLGFSIEETFAVVATTVLKTGQTGQAVTDALGRAFSAFTSSEIRDELLALANTTDQLFLTPSDFFDSGRTAFLKIVDQFAGLDQDLQNRISEIIGQRRETRFVRALLEGASQGELENILDIAGKSAGAAENRFAVLLATVQGTIEGVSQEFQELAQNLESLGVITPIKVLLSGLELVLKLINNILTGALDLVEAFNRIRIPFTDWGLGDALTTMLTLVTVAFSLRGLFQGIQLVIRQSSGGAAALLANLPLIGSAVAGGTGAGALGAVGGALGFSGFVSKVKEADGAVGKLGTTIGSVFLAPFRLIQSVIQGVTTRLYLWNAALIAGNTTTLTATGSETGLALARVRTNLANIFLIARTRAANAVLFGLGGTLRTLGGVLARLPVNILALAGALVTLRSVGGAVASALDAAFGPTRVQEINARTQEIIGQGEASGQPVNPIEAQTQAVQERLDELELMREEAEAMWTEFGLIITGLAFFGVENFEGTSQFIDLESRIAELELAKLQLIELQQQINSLNAAAGGGPELVESLQPTQDALGEIHRVIIGIDPQDPDLAQLQEAQALLEQARLIMEEDIPEILGGWGEVLTAAQIREAINNLQSDIQLGFVNTTEARRRLAELQENAIAGLEQAEAGGDPAAIAEAKRTLLDISLQDQQLFEQERDARLERAAIIEDNRLRLLAELRILRDFAVAAANNPNLGPEAVRQAQQDVTDAERAYNQAILEEAVARRQFEADNARTHAERVAALKALFIAVQAQIAARITATADALVPDSGDAASDRAIQRAAAAAVIASGAVGRTAAEDAQLQAILDALADEELRHAQLVARNSTLRNASSLDNIAAIAATANALRAEIQLLKQRGADEQEILAKEIELRDAVANQRLAESDRRAAFFRLTAGTGDEIKAAQAELRAALDRLAAIEALGGGDTQAGYEAELAVIQARQRLADLALRLADASRRANSDLTDSYQQALLDVQAAQEALDQATGDLEKIEAEISLAEAESRAQREFYDRRIADLDFLFQTDQIGRSQYIAALRALQAGIDRTTRQGEELWRDIELQIRGLQEDANQAFNIPTEIRLPTIFEVRRALAADALGVNYQDMRQQEINVFVSDEVDIEKVMDALNQAFGSSIDVESQRLASGGAGITIGGFN